MLNALAVLFLFLALRATFPREPLAAGIAAVILASFTGITHLLSQVQNDALLLPVCVLLLWAFLVAAVLVIVVAWLLPDWLI